MRRLFLGLFVAMFAPLPILACLNDRDSESIEAGQLPEVLAVITGQFDRNPPLYYQMRLKRVAEAIELTPVALPLYDDAAVACDRLGRFDEAIGWMEKKRALLERSDGDSPAIKEHWYRYYANVGTHWAHRWLKAGADRSRIGEMETARDFIGKAIAIKPDAHFGREKYQYKALSWIIKPVTIAKGVQALSSMFDEEEISIPHSEAIQGLCGLIVLGNAWESVDIFYALSEYLDSFGDHDLANQARMRCVELIDAGKGSLVPGAPRGEDLKAVLHRKDLALPTMVHLSDLVVAYQDGRKAAETRHRARADFMLERLREGRHPDTDATFWNGAAQSFAIAAHDEDREPASVIPPTMRRSTRVVVYRDSMPISVQIGLAVALALALVAIFGCLFVWLRLRNLSRKPAPVEVDWL